MGLLDILGLRKKKPLIKKSEIQITQETEQKLAQLGLDKEKDFLYKAFAEIIQIYPDGFETLSLMSKKSLTHNSGYPYAMIKKYGTQKVKEIVKKYGSANSVYLDDILKATEKYGQEVVDEISNKFDFDNLKIIAPHYRDYGENLTRKILSEYGDKVHHVFSVYKELEEAKKKSILEKSQKYDIIFYGEVQDVGFRGTSEYYAKTFDINCHAMNLSNGSVLCEVNGKESIIDVFILRLKKSFEVSKVIKKLN